MLYALIDPIHASQGQNNGDYWFRMELLARRDLSAAFPELFVFSGPLFIPEKVDVDPDKGISRYRRDDVPRYYLRHEVLGGGVSVPTHLFKAFAVRDPNEPSKFALSAFVVKNGPVDGTTPLSHWNVSRDQLSALTGWELLPGENPVPLCGNLYDCDEKFMKEAEYQVRAIFFFFFVLVCCWFFLSHPLTPLQRRTCSGGKLAGRELWKTWKRHGKRLLRMVFNQTNGQQLFIMTKRRHLVMHRCHSSKKNEGASSLFDWNFIVP